MRRKRSLGSNPLKFLSKLLLILENFFKIPADVLVDFSLYQVALPHCKSG